MRQSLQNKVNLLGVVFVVFFLLMLPMFTQVKADTRDSLKQAKNTFLAQWFRESAKEFKAPKNLENAQIEDYWGEQARKSDPDCGEACDPDADRDGDGVSNSDEYKNSQDPNCQSYCNPSCNEDQKSTEYCKGQDQFNLTKPDDVAKRVGVFELANFTIRYGSPECPTVSTTTFSTTCRRSFPVNETYDELVFYLNTTGYQGIGWTFAERHVESNTQPAWNGPAPSGGVAATPQNYAMRTGRIVGPPLGEYRSDLSLSGPQSGTWELRAYGVVR